MTSTHEPNEYGFGGGATAPEPRTEDDRTPDEEAEEAAEEIAVPDPADDPTQP